MRKSRGAALLGVLLLGGCRGTTAFSDSFSGWSAPFGTLALEGAACATLCAGAFALARMAQARLAARATARRRHVRG